MHKMDVHNRRRHGEDVAALDLVKSVALLPPLIAGEAVEVADVEVSSALRAQFLRMTRSSWP